MGDGRLEQHELHAAQLGYINVAVGRVFNEIDRIIEISKAWDVALGGDDVAVGIAGNRDDIAAGRVFGDKESTL